MDGWQGLCTRPLLHIKQTTQDNYVDQIFSNFDPLYGNRDCQVFKRGLQNWKDFCLKINMPEGNFEFWELVWWGGVKKCRIWLSKSIFYVKIIGIFLNLFFMEEYQFRNTVFCYWHFLIASIFNSLYFLKWCPIFDSASLHQFSKFNNFLWICWFFQFFIPRLNTRQLVLQ